MIVEATSRVKKTFSAPTATGEPKLVAVKRPATNAPEFRVEVISSYRLPDILGQWELLAANAVEVNPFEEPWMLLPALKALGCAREVEAALVWRSDPANAKSEPVLAGFFPFLAARRLKWLPVSEILSHIYCLSDVPLLHKDFARQALDAWLDWVKSPASPAPLVRFRTLPVDGPFHQLLVESVYSRGLFVGLERRYTRALFNRPADPSGYLAARFSGTSRKHFRRQRELLAASGKLEFRRLTPDCDFTRWIDEFLGLEAAGWKGREGTALDAIESHGSFFRAVTQAAHARERLSMSAFWLDGRMIAGRIAFRAAKGAYLFKIAYDETYSRYSPGTLLEVESIANSCGEDADWVDSGTTPEYPAYNHLWLDRRTVEDLIVSSGSLRGDFLVSILPFLKFVKSRFKRLGTESDLGRATSDAPKPEPGQPGS